MSGIETVKITVKIEVSVDISSMSGSLGFIFYSFRVLTSTTKLQSMSCIGPLVMEIHQVVFFINMNNASQVFSKEPYVTDSHLACKLNEIVQIYDLVYLHHQWWGGADGFSGLCVYLWSCNFLLIK